MKVLIIADVLGKENNGTTIACMNLIRYLTSNGYEVKVVCCDKDKKNDQNYYVVDSYNLGKFLNKYVAKNGVSIAKPNMNILKEAIMWCDICHMMTPLLLSRKALKICRDYSIPVTAGFHCQAENISSHIFCKDLKIVNNLIYHNFYKHFYKYVNAIHYPTEFIKNVFESKTKCDIKSYVISNGVNDIFTRKEVNKPKEYEDKYVILFIGRYSKEKSHDVLLKAVSKSKYSNKIQLIFAGTGPRKDHIIKLANKLKINMPIMNFYSRNELVNIINYSDLYCHPAEIEIEAISCLEAISCGLVPIIADSKRCATKKFALGKNNLFKCNDYNDLANKIDYWIEHKEEKELCSKKYLSKRHNYNYETCMKNMCIMLEEVLKESKNEKNILL